MALLWFPVSEKQRELVWESPGYFCSKPVLNEPDPHRNGEPKGYRTSLGPGVWSSYCSAAALSAVEAAKAVGRELGS